MSDTRTVPESTVPVATTPLLDNEKQWSTSTEKLFSSALLLVGTAIFWPSCSLKDSMPCPVAADTTLHSYLKPILSSCMQVFLMTVAFASSWTRSALLKTTKRGLLSTWARTRHSAVWVWMPLTKSRTRRTQSMI